MIRKFYKYIILVFVLIIPAVMAIISVSATATVSDNGAVLPPQPLDPNKNITGIELVSLPFRTQYILGEKLDMSGAIIMLKYEGGEQQKSGVKLEWCSGFDSSEVGIQEVTITYENTAHSTTLEVEVVEETGIKIAQPQKLVYFLGDNEDTKGLAVSVVYSNGKSSALDSGYTVTGFDSSTVGEKTITVQYKKFTATYTVKVVETSLDEIKIESKPLKLSYFVGEELDTAGIKIMAYYNDGHKSDVTSKVTISGDLETEGTKQITVVYTERDHIKTAVFEVEVLDIKIESIEFETKPPKTIYFDNEIFDPAGISIKVTYNNGTIETVSEGMTFTGFNTDSVGKKTVTLHYRGEHLDFEIEILIAATHEHTEGEMILIKEANCTEDGEQVSYCTVCMHAVNRIVIPALGHGMESDPVIEKAPTCTDAGQMATKCMVCGESVTVSEIPALGHTESDIQILKEPNCTETGLTKTFCLVCSSELTSTVLEALGHKFGEWILVAEPTDEIEGCEERTCSACQIVDINIIPKLTDLLDSNDISASLTSPDLKYPAGTSFNASKITDALTADEIASLIPENEYIAIDVFEFVFTDIRGEVFTPEYEIIYSVKYVLPVNEYSSFLIYDTEMGCYTPVTSDTEFSFTVQRSGRFILVGEPIPETTQEDITSDPAGSDDTTNTQPITRNVNSFVILALLVIAFILIIIIGALVYTYVIKQDA